jgi:hypothetical protein
VLLDTIITVPPDVTVLWATVESAVERVAIEQAVTKSARAGIEHLLAQRGVPGIPVPVLVADVRHHSAGHGPGQAPIEVHMHIVQPLLGLGEHGWERQTVEAAPP